MDEKPVVNAWTEWGPLEQVVVGRANYATYMKEHMDLFDWPFSPIYQPTQLVADLDSQLNGLIDVLQGECIRVTRSDKIVTSKVLSGCHAEKKSKLVRKASISVSRPEIFDFNRPIKSPGWEMPTMGNGCNPRDIVITMGNTILEAPMSYRSRFFEYLPYRKLINELWHSDNRVLWKATPKPSMDDGMYDQEYRQLPYKQRPAWHHEKMTFNLTESEPAFDAADILRCGKDIFVNHGYMSNLGGIEWLRREFPQIRVNQLHFLDDKIPIHIDSTFVPLRPPKGLEGTEGLVMINPARPPVKAEMDLWRDNNWHMVPAPKPETPRRKNGLTSCWTFNMNLLSLGNDKIIMNSSEVPTYDLLTDLGFDVITCDFDIMTEFGGGIHCATWDIRRNDTCQDFFPNQGNAQLLAELDKSERYVKVDEHHPFCKPKEHKYIGH